MRTSMLLGVLALLLWSSAVEAAPPDVPHGSTRYLIVLKTGGNSPDFSAAGGKVRFSQGDYRVVDIPAQAIEGIRRNPNVHYIQRAVPPQEALAVHSSALDPYQDPVASGSRAIQAVPVPANWDSGLYQYDGRGNIKAIGPHTYRYDQLGRLSGASYGRAGAVPEVNETYAYDLYGNLTGRAGGGTPVPPSADPTTNRISSSAGAVYDGAGNLQKYGTHERYHDPGRMMRRLMPPSGTTYYLYTANDERIGVIDDAWRGTWTLRDLGGKVLRQFTTLDSQFWYWSWQEDDIHGEGSILAAQRIPEKGGTIHFHSDHLGTPRQITSGAGEELSRHDYDPFGRELTAITQLSIRGWNANSFQFTGHERDYHSGTYAQNVDYDDYMHARYYSPSMGRFLSVDPGGWNKHKPQSWNRYSYVLNNPINMTDPDGREPVGGAAGAFIGFVAGAVVEVHSQGWGWQRPVNYTRVWNSAVGGATAGAITGACKCPVALGGAMGGVAGGVITRDLNGDKQTVTAVAADAVGGATGAVGGKVVGGKLVSESTEGLTMKAAALRAQSAANNTGLGADKIVHQQIKAATVVGQQTGDAIVSTPAGIAQTTATQKIEKKEKRP